MLAARAAKRWLRRNAAGVKLVRICTPATISVCMNLVFCLPALEDAELSVRRPLVQNDLRCLLDALAGCPNLRALDLSMEEFEFIDHEELHWQESCKPAFAKLSGLTKLALAFDESDVVARTLEELVRALASLTALAELSLDLPVVDQGPEAIAVVPGALTQFKGLRSLALYNLGPCVFKAGCLNLPNLQGLVLGAATLGMHRCCQASLLSSASRASSCHTSGGRASLTLSSVGFLACSAWWWRRTCQVKMMLVIARG